MTPAPRTETSAGASLVERCRRGEELAWRELVERFSRYVAAITRLHGLGHAEADDAFQETFLRTWRNLERIPSDEALRQWIGQVARRLCIDRLRSLSREAPDEEVVAAAPDAAGDRLAELDLALDVHAALATLSEDCRAVLDAFFCRDRSYAQIATELDLASGTIASRISRCLAKLRDRMAPQAA